MSVRRTQNAVEAEDLRKSFGAQTALDGLDLAVPEGRVCGLLGPNGAGKTTAVRILATLLRPDAGRATVAGFDVAREAAEVRRRIALTSQHDAIDEVLTGRQNLELFGRLLHLSPAAARRRADELLERFGLTDAANRKAKEYSGGMRRRLDLAAGFVLRPQVLFLDEPTTGQDPRNRNEVWDVVRGLVAEGTTVLLTTHYLDEADQLADQICVIDHGRVIAAGTPDQLKARVGGTRIDIVVRRADDLPAAAALLERACGAGAELAPDVRRASAPAPDRVTTLGEVLRGLDEQGIEAEDVAARTPTLDEAFLTLTGARPEQEEVAA